MITSVSNQRVKRITALVQKSRLRSEQDVFVIEGEKMFLEAPTERILEVYVSEHADLVEKTRQKLDQLPTGVCETVTDEVFARMSDTRTPQGILCVIRQFHYDKKKLLSDQNALFVLLENLQDPGNLGTILRTAEGAGVTAVIMSRGTVDIYNPKTIRATMGSVYRVPFWYEEDLIAAMGEMRTAGIHIYAAHLRGDHSYTQEDYTGPTAFVIGNEGAGLTDSCADAAGKYIRIPMKGQLESLNAGVATALLLYEADRQRNEWI